MKEKYRLQKYKTTSAFFCRSESFLLRNESSNNLFWEVAKYFSEDERIWAANLFSNGEIILCAIQTKSGYVLLSTGNKSAVRALATRARKDAPAVRGVLGPTEQCTNFVDAWFGTKAKNSFEKKNFRIYELSNVLGNSCQNSEMGMVRAGSLEWPRIRLWAEAFAKEAIPPISQTATISMARKILDNGNFYILRKNSQSCGMAGFGRSTPNRLVVNMVYVPENQRHRGYAKLIARYMSIIAAKRGYSSCILFSDHKGENLYEKLGGSIIGEFSEVSFF